MNLAVLLQGVIEIVLAFITGILVFFMSFKLFMVLTRRIDDLKELKNNNIALGLMIATFIFSIMLIFRMAIIPVMDTVGYLINNHSDTSLYVYGVFKIILMFAVTSICSFFIVWGAIQFFMLLTRDVDEMLEIKNNNIAISILISSIIISLTLLLMGTKDPNSGIVNGPIRTILDSFSLYVGPNDSEQSLVNGPILIKGLIELGITLLGGIIIFFLSFKLFTAFTRNIDDMKELKANNIAIALFASSFIIAITIIMRSAIIPAYNELNILINSEAGIGKVFISSLKVLLFFASSGIIGFLIIWLSVKALMLLTTKIEEQDEIKKGNVAVALIISVLILSK